MLAAECKEKAAADCKLRESKRNHSETWKKVMHVGRILKHFYLYIEKDLIQFSIAWNEPFHSTQQQRSDQNASIDIVLFLLFPSRHSLPSCWRRSTTSHRHRKWWQEKSLDSSSLVPMSSLEVNRYEQSSLIGTEWKYTFNFLYITTKARSLAQHNEEDWK